MIWRTSDPLLMPAPLKPGDTIRFVSPASSPRREDIEASADLLRAWGFLVDFGPNAFRKLNYLAGTDDERLSDFNAALNDPDVRAIFATAGGKGSYRIANRLDFAAARRDPKYIVGFSDISILHMAMLKAGIGGAIHGALRASDWDGAPDGTQNPLKSLLTGADQVTVPASVAEPTIALTTSGRATGPLVGGNLDMVATAAGWALPPLAGCIVLIEAVNMYLGQVDRQLTMLKNAGHLDGVAGIAIGQFTDFKPSGTLTIIDLLRDHLKSFDVPILGGLPLGHGPEPWRIPLGHRVLLDADQRTLQIPN